MERRVLTLLLVATVMVLVWAEMGLLAWFLAAQTTGWLLTTPELTSPWWLRWWASWVSGSGGSSLPSTKIDSPTAATPPQQNTWPPHTPQTNIRPVATRGTAPAARALGFLRETVY